MRQRILGVGRGIMQREPNYVYYWLRFLVGLGYGLISPAYALFLFRFGLNAWQVSITNLVYVLGVMLLQIPAGALADTWGRKKVFLLSTLANWLSFWIYAFGRKWPVFVAGEGVSAVGTALMVGVLEAWVVDAWRQRKPVGEHGFIFSRAEMAAGAATLGGGFLGGIMAVLSLRLPFFIGGLLHLTVLVTGFFLIEEKRPKQRLNLIAVWKRSVTTAQKGIQISIQESKIWKIAFSAGMMMFGYKALDLFWSQRFVTLSGGRVAMTGYIWVMASLFMMAGSQLLKHWRDRKTSYLKVFAFMSLLGAIAVCLSGLTGNFYLSVFFFLWYELTRGMNRPAWYGYASSLTDSGQRATVLSFVMTAVSVGGALGLVILGWAAKQYSIETSWLIAAGVFILALIPLRQKKYKGLKV